MSTIGKALSLLDLISVLDKDIGLSDLARLSTLDKATTRRFLVELERHGFVEQDEETRRYRLGAAPVRQPPALHDQVEFHAPASRSCRTRRWCIGIEARSSPGGLSQAGDLPPKDRQNAVSAGQEG